MKLKIKKYPDPVLRKKAGPVYRITAADKQLLDDMLETMYEAKGIGLAAPQIGISRRIAVIDTGYGPIKMVDPEIISKKGMSQLEEGCLSIPDRAVNIKRADELTVSYIDEDNKRREIHLTGLAARAVQHEIDHLNGRLIIDYIAWYKKFFVNR